MYLMSKNDWIILTGVFDILISLPFIASNLYIWQYLAGRITVNAWGPLQMSIAPQTIINGQAETIVLVFPFPNYPFILFWVALAGNFALLVLALRSKNSNKNTEDKNNGKELIDFSIIKKDRHYKENK
jgi:hypothetical protein